LPATFWPAAIAAAFAFALMAGTALARGGGGRGGAMAHPPAPHGASPARMRMPTPLSPGATLPRASALTAAPAPSVRAQPLASASSLAQTTNTGVAVTIAPPAPAAAATQPSAIGDPTPALAPLAPLSSQLPEQFATSSVAQPNSALSPGGSSGSPSETAPSAPGGGGKTLADCMGFWDRETHMTKAEWRGACIRSMQEYPSVFR
jgi:hypothetical protein